MPEINAVSILELVVYGLCCVHTLQGTRKLEYIVLLHVHIFCQRFSVVSYHDLKPNCMFAYCGPGMCFMKWMISGINALIISGPSSIVSSSRIVSSGSSITSSVAKKR